MQLAIAHTTRFQYDAPVQGGGLQLRLTPGTGPTQTVLDWDVALEGAQSQARFTDHHGNHVELVEPITGATEVVIHVSGTVETVSQTGVLGEDSGLIPLWLYRRPTPMTQADAGIDALAAGIAGSGLDRLHALSEAILATVPYRVGATQVGARAIDVLALGEGVCQDHAHLFLACARSLSFPARYVSGYLMINDRIEQDASHAWAEAYLDGLGWVGFDVSNGISPDERYVRVACGMDYADCAPTWGLTRGGANERLEVAVQVQQ